MKKIIVATMIMASLVSNVFAEDEDEPIRCITRKQTYSTAQEEFRVPLRCPTNYFMGASSCITIDGTGILTVSSARSAVCNFYLDTYEGEVDEEGNDIKATWRDVEVEVTYVCCER